MPAFRTASEEETIALGERLASELPAKAVVLLIGNLGAGKTTLVNLLTRFYEFDEGEILIDGKVLRGPDSWAGEIGHLNVRPRGPACG